MRAAFQGKEPQICAKECTIEKIIVLPVQQYEKFTKNLLQRYDFIAENLNLMGISGDTWNCILVTARGVRGGGVGTERWCRLCEICIPHSDFDRRYDTGM